MKYYLAIDIGASSGRHILAHIENEKLVLEEIYRFKNGFEKKSGHLCWNIENLFAEIKNGLKKCKEIDKISVSMGIDTWGVDFVFLDERDRLIGDAVSYRDSRTDGMDKEVEKLQNKTYKSISIVDGGSQDNYLDELTAKITGKKVFAGPVEATATGNILIQLAADDEKYDTKELVRKSFDIKCII